MHVLIDVEIFFGVSMRYLGYFLSINLIVMLFGCGPQKLSKTNSPREIRITCPDAEQIAEAYKSASSKTANGTPIPKIKVANSDLYFTSTDYLNEKTKLKLDSIDIFKSAASSKVFNSGCMYNMTSDRYRLWLKKPGKDDFSEGSPDCRVEGEFQFYQQPGKYSSVIENYAASDPKKITLICKQAK